MFKTCSKVNDRKMEPSQRKQSAMNPHAALVYKTLAEDYPGLDYLNINSVLTAKHRWYKILWFSILIILLASTLYTVYRLIVEYMERPTSTRIIMKSVEQILLPQVTICPTTPMTINLNLLSVGLHSIQQFKNINNETVRDFGVFMIAGSGFQKMDAYITMWNDTYINYLTNIYDTFRQGMDTRAFFYKFFNTYGLQCEDLFQFCKLGSIILNCCDIFSPTYTIRRGRCFKTNRPLYQRNEDELGKFRIQLLQPVKKGSKSMNQILLYITDAKPDIEPYPRYYLYDGQYTKVRLTSRFLDLLPGTEHCSNEYSNLGTASCYLIKWIIDNLEKPHHCTYPYMDNIRFVDLPSCDAEVMVKYYQTTVNAKDNNNHNCTLPCKRWQYAIDLDRTFGPPQDDSVSRENYSFRADISYNELQYEEVKEVLTLTRLGLLAQIGGQLSLFLGTSIMSIFQVAFMIMILSRRGYRRAWLRRGYIANNLNPTSTIQSNGKEIFSVGSERFVPTVNQLNKDKFDINNADHGPLKIIISTDPMKNEFLEKEKHRETEIF